MFQDGALSRESLGLLCIPQSDVFLRRRFFMQSSDAEDWSVVALMFLFYKRNSDASCLLPPSWGQTGLDSKSCSLALLLGALPAGGGRQSESGWGGGPTPAWHPHPRGPASQMPSDLAGRAGHDSFFFFNLERA